MVYLCPQTVTAGSYVLGVLGDDETDDFRRHAVSCRSCRSEIQELSPVARLLEPLRPGVPAPRRPR